MLVIPVLGKLRQKNYKFKVSFGYVVRPFSKQKKLKYI